MRRRVLIADDHPMVRDAVRMAIMSQLPHLVVEEATEIESAERIAQTRQDIALLLLDYQLPDAEGFSGFFRLQHVLGNVPIAIISAFDEPKIINAAKAVGAAGFISKSQPLDQIAMAIGTLVTGGVVFPAAPAIPDALRDMGARMETLSSAQKRVLAALVRGDLNKQIAADLELTEATIKAHLTAIFRKLGVSNRLQAILSVKPLLDPEGEP
ncbi:response regulator transcription factor [Novosphingobium sp. PS1R-30]|uniref:Response regulator transcription factor n=1 Tax=Novosphingobium anseongense TaxID=3133436 RepID=A0ABU8RPR1_9SPHN